MSIKAKINGVRERRWSAVEAGRQAMFARNYFGNGSDGDLHVVSDLQLASTQDGDMIVKNYRNLTIDAGATLTVSDRCRGLLLYVVGDLIGSSDPANPAVISMTARGCHANPADSDVTSDTPVAPSDGNAVHADGIQIPFLTASGADTLTAHLEGFGNDAYALNGKYAALVGRVGKLVSIPRVGGAGAPRTASDGDGANGTAGTGGQTGGGGASGDNRVTDGAQTQGASGTCFSGGSGGGYADVGGEAESYGGQGGDCSMYSNHGSGAGNPAGDLCDVGMEGEDGTGGLLVVIVSGDVTGNITLRADGMAGGDSSSYTQGGGSGGGVVILAHRGTSSATLMAGGGLGGSGSNAGGDGGAGSVIEIGDLI